MTFETLTYQTQSTDFSVSCVSGPQEARQKDPQGAPKGEPQEEPSAALPAGPSNRLMADMAMRFWLWMSKCLGECLAQCLSARPLRGASRGQHIILWPPLERLAGPDAFAAPDCQTAPACALRVNRSLARRLRRLARRCRGEDRFNLLRFQQNSDISHLSPGQYLEWMIRVYRWGRTRLYGLNMASRELRHRAVRDGRLQGAVSAFGKAGLCAAPLSPD